MQRSWAIGLMDAAGCSCNVSFNIIQIIKKNSLAFILETTGSVNTFLDVIFIL